MTFSTTGSPLEARAQNQSQFPLIFGVAAGIVLVVALALMAVRRIMKPFQSPEYIAKQKKRPTTRKDLKAVTEEYGLSNEESQYLERLCQRHKTPNIKYYVKDYAQLLSLFKTAYQDSLEEKDADESQETLFSVFNKMNRMRLAVNTMTNTQSLPEGQRLLYVDSDGSKYVTRILSTNPTEMTLSTPKNKAGRNLLPEALSKISLMMQGKDEIVYMMQVRVIRLDNRGEPVIVTTHGTQFESFLKHEYSYISERIHCRLQAAFAQPSDSGGVVYTVSGGVYSALLLNYSGTSCNIAVKNAINVHQLLRMTVKLDNKTAEDIIVMVMNVIENEKQRVFILHANFVKMDERIKNRILARIYSFAAA